MFVPTPWSSAPEYEIHPPLALDAVPLLVDVVIINPEPNQINAPWSLTGPADFTAAGDSHSDHFDAEIIFAPGAMIEDAHTRQRPI